MQGYRIVKCPDPGVLTLMNLRFKDSIFGIDLSEHFGLF